MGLLLAGVCGVASAADKPACETNYKQEGGFLSGRQFSTWDVLPNVSPETAFKKIYAEGVKSGLKVANSDKEMGMLSFEQNQTSGNKQVSLTWNVAVEAEGKGSKITVSKMTPAGYATGQGYQIKSMCAVIDSAR